MPRKNVTPQLLSIACLAAAASAWAQSPEAGSAADTVSFVAGHPCARPVWPAASLAAKESGIVTLKLLIDVDGTVAKSEVVRSSGHAALDEAARAAISKCHFAAGLREGQAVRAWQLLQYVWKLD